MTRIIGKMSDWMLGRVVPEASARAADVGTQAWAGCCDWQICRFCSEVRCWCAQCLDLRCR